MTARSRLPMVGIPADARDLGPHPFHAVGDKYVRAVADGAGAWPVILPALGDWYDVDAVLDRLDGLFFPGSPSNVHPTRYGVDAALAVAPHDPQRDATTLPLLTRAVERGVPVLAVCRGFQELNVALGGTLHPKVHEAGPFADHREDKESPLDVQYGPAHPVALTAGGYLATITGQAELMVNSLHGQGIDRLAPALMVEATAPDGLVEAVRVPDHPFALAVQWHPEWRFWENPASTALFKAFGEAVAFRAGAR
ncbi:MAG: hypothetical protein RLY86_958 [Pseudomonadota bacterium]|jgi:putative glutamine amidotransferase